MTQVRTPRQWRDTHRAAANRVTMVEIFFDLVFVLTLTQLTRMLEADLSLAGVGRVLLLFGILWWMFDGYVWLPNHVPPQQPVQKLLLFAAMAGFLIAAVGMPHAFGETGLLFAMGYLVAICVHLLMFTQADVGRALGWLAAYNLGSALLVLAGGFAHGTFRYGLWLAALVLQTVIPYLVPRLSWMSLVSSFRIEPTHFVERHGLLVIIALGESIVAIAVGVDGGHLTAGIVAAVVLALALPAAMWWAYFTDAGITGAALAAAEPGPRARLALRTGFAHVPLMLGVVIAAAGIHSAVAHPDHPSSWAAALALAGGVAVFLAGIAEIRHSLHTVPVRTRLVTAVAVLAMMPIGVAVNAGLHLAAVVAVLVAMLAVDRHAARTLGSPPSAP
ncbi:low temperature requirement protein A [Micromonospora sp. CA-259024]|uniref:low temperature requirement protein A n=1 Tax=Micromonospora sp. CA-259024 TaxID=3239965 RepID=UPI003D8F0C3B